MRIKNLSLIVLVVFLLASCASEPSVPPEELRIRADDAVRVQMMCARQNVSQIDDGISDAQSIALGLALRCSHEYQQATEAISLARFDNNRQRRRFRENRNSTEKKIEVFLPVVMDHRASLRKKAP